MRQIVDRSKIRARGAAKAGKASAWAICCFAFLLSGCANSSSDLQSLTTTSKPAKETTHVKVKPKQGILTSVKKVSQDVTTSIDGSIKKISKLELPKTQLDPPAMNGDQLSSSPEAVYTLVASGLHKCWLSDGKPLSHGVFYGKAASPRHKEDRSARIYVLDRSDGKKRGEQLFAISMKPNGQGTLVQLSNRKLSRAQTNKLIQDLRRFVKNDIHCLSSKIIHAKS